MYPGKKVPIRLKAEQKFHPLAVFAVREKLAQYLWK
jgi:hypothetical protein